MNFETPINLGDRIAQSFKGWFVAPATARHRFYMSCDDQCKVEMDLTPGSVTNKTVLTKSNRWSQHREFWKENDLNADV